MKVQCARSYYKEYTSHMKNEHSTSSVQMLLPGLKFSISQNFGTNGKVLSQGMYRVHMKYESSTSSG